MKSTISLFILLLFRCAVQTATAQQYTLDQAIAAALENNEGLKAASLDVSYYRELKKTSTDVGKLSAVWMHGQYNSYYADNNFTVMQSLPFPTTMASQARLGKEQIAGAEKNLQASKNDLAYEVKSAYYQLLFLQAYAELLQTQDSLYSDFARASSARFKTGESNLLEKTTAEAQSQDAKNLILQNQSDIRIQQTRLQALLKTDRPVIALDRLTLRSADTLQTSPEHNPRLEWFRQQGAIGTQARRLEQQRLLPDLSFGYFNQSLRGVQNVNGTDRYYGSGTRFQGLQLGIALPIWIAPHIARIRAAAFHESEMNKTADYYATSLRGQYSQALQELQKNNVSLTYYTNVALGNAALLLKQAKKSFREGEIGYIEYLQSLKTGISIKTSYLNVLNQYNQSVVKIEFLLGNL